MTPIRTFATALLVLAASPTLAAPDLTALRSAFERLAPAARHKVQSELEIAGFYRGGIDGRYGAGTERALIQGAAFLAQNSRGRIAFDLEGAVGIAAYLDALASGGTAAYLYGEGEMCEDGMIDGC